VSFVILIDWIIKNALTGLDVGLEWMNNSKLCDLDYAYDIVLLKTSVSGMQLMTEAVENEGKKVGLYMNVGKCNVLFSNDWRDDTEIKIGSSAVERQLKISAVWAAF